MSVSYIDPTEATTMLRRLLADAEQGNIKSFAIAILWDDDAIGSGWSSETNIIRTLGCIEILKNNLVDVANENMEN